jgi:HAD superfamily hydrolase (TIGR01509 family)
VVEGPIKAVVFDMDGVLIDAKDWHYEALNRALSLFAFQISRYDHLVTYDGLPTRRKLEMLTLERGLPRALHPFLNELKQQYTMELVHAHCRPVFGKEYALSRLKEDGYRLAVASNSIRHTVEVMMEKAALARYLDALLSNQDVQRPKPDPEIYLAAARRLGVAPAECLVVEDNENGIKAAQASGAHLLAVAGVGEVTYDRIVDAIRAVAARAAQDPQRVRSVA